MFSKIWTFAILIVALALQAQAHAGVSPVLGVAGAAKRTDVKRPSAANPCGAGVNIAGTIDKSTAVQAAADGSFKATAVDFNAGGDGSRQFTAQVDATGVGKTFVAAKVTTNGDPAPKTVGSQPLVVQLPAGTKCTGGATKNKCLVSFKSSAGFGNCVVVQQGGGARTAVTKKGKKAAAGTRAARAMLAGLETRFEDTTAKLKRSITDWMWV